MSIVTCKYRNTIYIANEKSNHHHFVHYSLCCRCYIYLIRIVGVLVGLRVDIEVEAPDWSLTTWPACL